MDGHRADAPRLIEAIKAAQIRNAKERNIDRNRDFEMCGEQGRCGRAGVAGPGCHVRLDRTGKATGRTDLLRSFFTRYCEAWTTSKCRASGPTYRAWRISRHSGTPIGFAPAGRKPGPIARVATRGSTRAMSGIDQPLLGLASSTMRSRAETTTPPGRSTVIA